MSAPTVEVVRAEQRGHDLALAYLWGMNDGGVHLAYDEITAFADWHAAEWRAYAEGGRGMRRALQSAWSDWRRAGRTD